MPGYWWFDKRNYAGRDFERLPYPFYFYQRLTPIARVVSARFDVPDNLAYFLRNVRAFWPVRQASPARVWVKPAMQVRRPSSGDIYDQAPIPLELLSSPGESWGGSSLTQTPPIWYSVQINQFYQPDDAIYLDVTFTGPAPPFLDLLLRGTFQPLGLV